MKKTRNTPKHKTRMSISISDDVNSQLNDVSSALGFTKARVIRDILTEAVPELHSQVTNFKDILSDNPELNPSSVMVSSVLSRLSEVLMDLSKSEAKK